MAQWLGQFTGNTHETKVHDAEDALQHSVDVYRSLLHDASREKKAKAILKQAERLLRARQKLAGARHAVARERRLTLNPELRDKELKPFEDKERLLRDGGVDAILAEFGVAEL